MKLSSLVIMLLRKYHLEKLALVCPYLDIESGHMIVMWLCGGKIFSSLIIVWVGIELRSLLHCLNLKNLKSSLLLPQLKPPFVCGFPNSVDSHTVCFSDFVVHWTISNRHSRCRLYEVTVKENVGITLS